jgi:hypothetical protein
MTTMIVTAAAGAAAWFAAPWAAMAVRGTVDQRQKAACH